MTGHFICVAALVTGLAFPGAVLAQTSGSARDPAAAAGAPPPATGSKVQALPGSTVGTTGSTEIAPPGAAPAGSGSKAESLPPPDTSTPGPRSGATPVPPPSGTTTK
jgi:hypothetical protein